MKCTNCGNEFEGKFCPECGTPAEPIEQKCPQCGKIRQNNEKFCSECGYSWINNAAGPANNAAATANAAKVNGDNALITTVLKYLSYVPAFAFALFSILLFIFYATPLCTFFGESFGNNVYMGVEELPSLNASRTTLIILAVIGLCLSAFAVAAQFLPQLKNKRFFVANKNISLNYILIPVYCALLVIYFIIGCVICGIISSEDGEMEMIDAGAAPILIIVFSVIFLLVCCGAFVAEILIGKKFPEAKTAVKIAAANELKRKTTYAINKPAKPEKISYETVQDREVVIIANKFERLKMRALCSFFIALLIFLLFFIILNAFAINYDIEFRNLDADMRGEIYKEVTYIYSSIIFSVPIILSIVFLVIVPAVISAARKNKFKKDWNIKEAIKAKGMRTLQIINLIMIIAFFGIAALIMVLFILEDLIDFVFAEGQIYFAFILAIIAGYQIIWAIVVKARMSSHRKKLKIAFYGTKKPKKGAEPIISYDALYAQLNEIKLQNDRNKKQYKAQLLEYKNSRLQ